MKKIIKICKLYQGLNKRGIVDMLHIDTLENGKNDNNLIILS